MSEIAGHVMNISAVHVTTFLARVEVVVLWVVECWKFSQPEIAASLKRAISIQGEDGGCMPAGIIVAAEKEIFQIGRHLTTW